MRLQTEQSSRLTLLPRKFMNLILLLITLILGLVTFFALMEIILAIAAFIIVRTSYESFRQPYMVGTIRNLWLICGGCLFLGFVIGVFDYHTKRLGNVRTLRILLGTLMIEIVIIGIRLVL